MKKDLSKAGKKEAALFGGILKEEDKKNSGSLAVNYDKDVKTVVKSLEMNIKNFNRITVNILQDLIWLKDHQDKLLAEEKITFQEFIEQKVGFGKSYFYAQIRAYDICVENGKPDIYNDADYRVLLEIGKVDNKKERLALLDRSPEIKRKDIKSEIKKITANDKQIENKESNIIDADFTVIKKDDVNVFSPDWKDEETTDYLPKKKREAVDNAKHKIYITCNGEIQKKYMEAFLKKNSSVIDDWIKSELSKPKNKGDLDLFMDEIKEK